MTIEKYLEDNFKHLYTQARKLTKTDDLAREMVQELSIIILTDFKYSGDFDSNKMNTYCWGIMLNMMRQSVRDKKKWVKEELFDSASITYIEVDEKTFRKTFYEWELEKLGYSDLDIKRLSNIKFQLSTLEPYELNLYKMYFEEGMSLSGIGKRVRLPKSTIFNHMKSLKLKLSEMSKKDSGLKY